MSLGINEDYEYTELELCSFDSLDPFNSTYRIENWPLFFLGKTISRIAAIKIIEVEIPFTYYVFTSFNNSFELQEYSGGSWSASQTVTIPVGNYSVAEILDTLASILTAASTGAWVYTVEFTSRTNKLTITNTMSVAGEQFRLVFGDPAGNDQGLTNPRRWLGFTKGYNTSTVFPTTCTLEASDCLTLNGWHYAYINSVALSPITKIILPGNGIVNPAESGADGPQIARIPLMVEPGGICTWQDPDPTKWFPTNDIDFSNAIDFYVSLGTNDPKVPVDFNGGTFSIKLGILQNRGNQVTRGQFGDVETKPLKRIKTDET